MLRDMTFGSTEANVKTVDIIYRYSARETAIRSVPSDSNTALLRLEEGNRSFATLLDHVKDESGIQQVIPVDPRDLGLISGGAEMPKQRPFAAILGCSDARVRPEIGKVPGFAHLGKSFCQVVRELNWQRHELLSLVASIAEHHTLIAGTNLSPFFGHTNIDVRRLRMQRSQNRRSVHIETIERRGVSNYVADVTNHLPNVEQRRRRDLAADD